MARPRFLTTLAIIAELTSPSTLFAQSIESVDNSDVGIAQTQAAQGSIVGWGWQVVGGDLSGGFVAVAAGSGHSLGLKANGSIVSWGFNREGQTNVPGPNTGFVAVAAGQSHSLGLKADGSIVAWGCGVPYDYGQCNVPAPNTGFVALAAGQLHSLGLKADGSIVGWG